MVRSSRSRTASEVADKWLNEDSSSEPQNSTKDDSRVRVTLEPIKSPEEFTSEESNLRQVELQP
jgi:hypothetical protein